MISYVDYDFAVKLKLLFNIISIQYKQQIL